MQLLLLYYGKVEWDFADLEALAIKGFSVLSDEVLTEIELIQQRIAHKESLVGSFVRAASRQCEHNNRALTKSGWPTTDDVFLLILNACLMLTVGYILLWNRHHKPPETAISEFHESLDYGRSANAWQVAQYSMQKDLNNLEHAISFDDAIYGAINDR